MTNDTAGEDPLRDLVLDAAEVDRAAIARALKGRVGIDSKSGRVVLSPGFNALDARRKVLTVLLARKAAHLLDLTDSETIGHREIVEASGLPSGTVAPTLKALREARLVAQDDAKAYYVPNAQINAAVGLLTSE
jgi:hypothetical protein